MHVYDVNPEERNTKYGEGLTYYGMQMRSNDPIFQLANNHLVRKLQPGTDGGAFEALSNNRDHLHRESLFDAHFVFNAMTVIQNMILSGNRTRALEGLQRLSGYLRQLNAGGFHRIALDQLESYLNAYIGLQNIRTNNSCALLPSAHELPPEVSVRNNILEHELNALFEQNNVCTMRIAELASDSINIMCEIEQNNGTTQQVILLTTYTRA